LSHHALKNHRKEKITTWALVLMSALPGSVCLFLHLFTNYEVSQANSWPSVDAVVSHSEFSRSSYLSYGWTGNHVFWKTDFSFRFNYEVDGRSYTSTRFYASDRQPSVAAANEYPVGQHFRALYNPSNPADAVVEPGSVGRMYITLALILLGFSMFTLVCNFRQL
jgi:hypothetical protein